MCMDGGGDEANRAAQRAEQEEAERQRKIEQGRDAIDRAFYGIEGSPIYQQPDADTLARHQTLQALNAMPGFGFGGGNIPLPNIEPKMIGRTDTGFYDKANQSYLNYYLPQLDEQYDDYNRRNIFALANRGLLQSSVKGEADADLTDQYQVMLDKIHSGAGDYEKGLRGDVSDAKSNLMNMVLSGTDPASVSSMAANRSALLARPGSFDPLGDVFTQLATQAQNRHIAQGEGYEQKKSPGLLFGTGSSGNSNVKVVN